jgi:hypothetical protein
MAKEFIARRGKQSASSVGSTTSNIENLAAAMGSLGASHQWRTAAKGARPTGTMESAVLRQYRHADGARQDVVLLRHAD